MSKLLAPPLTVMVSSTVYDKKGLLGRVYAILTESFGHEVWMSHKGTIPVNPNLHNFDNCLLAVEKCDLFLGIISPFYGTGIATKNSLSITHLELLRSIELKKPRFMLCHSNVVTARTLLNSLSYMGTSLRGISGRKKLSLISKSYISDLKTIDMYENAALEGTPVSERTNHWVQEYQDSLDAINFVKTSFDPEGANRVYLNEISMRKRLFDSEVKNDQ